MKKSSVMPTLEQMRLNRRGLLQAGSMTFLASSLPAGTGPSNFGRAKRCITLFLSGGASQHDTWDPKPDAPEDVRGELSSIESSVPGIRFGELFPRTALQAHHCTVIRSMTHNDTLHTTAGYQMLTGFVHQSSGAGGNSVDRRPLPTDNPHLGSLLTKIKPSIPGVPTFAALPEVLTDGGITIYPGLVGGLLGRRFDPLLIQGSNETRHFQTPAVMPPSDVDRSRLAERLRLLDQLEARDAGWKQFKAGQDFVAFQQRALDMAQSPKVRDAFNLDQEPARLREAYGPHVFGQSCLMGRRLLEAGVSLVAIYWPQDNNTKDSPVWDTHEDQAGNLKRRLAPFGDAAIASLISDLAARGMLDDTLFVCMTEFGRTPKITNQGSRVGGREHWPFVYSILLAGAGTPAGCIYGASDRMGGLPSLHPVSPQDFAATQHWLLGLPSDLHVTDAQGRPQPICIGKPVKALLG